MAADIRSPPYRVQTLQAIMSAENLPVFSIFISGKNFAVIY